MNNQELFSTGESTPLTRAERVGAVAKSVIGMIAEELGEAIDEDYIKEEETPEVIKRIVDDLSRTIAQEPPKPSTSLGEFSGLGTLFSDAEQPISTEDTPRPNHPV